MRSALRRVRGRAAFSQFKRATGRAASGPLQVRYVADPAQPQPSFAFTVSRRSGNAVTRNRIRRRVRAALREMPPGTFRPGSYLISAETATATLPYPALVRHLSRALRAAGRGEGARSRNRR